MYDIQDLKARNNIIDVAEELGLQPKRSGAAYFARCPSHDDQGRPNLALHVTKGAICFRCGYKADVIKLVADIRFHGDQGEAMNFLASRAGLTDHKAKRPGRKTDPLPRGAPLPPEAVKTESSPEAAWETLTVIFPAGANVITVGDGRSRWRRLEDDQIEVIYNLDELTIALTLAGYNMTPEATAALSTDEIAWVLSGVFNCELTPGRVRTASAIRLTNRVKIYEALLSFCDSMTAAGDWLYKRKGIRPETQATFGIGFLAWEKAAKGLTDAFGVNALDALGLMARDKKTGKPIELRFRKHRLLFPFWLTSDERRYPVYLQGRDVNATDKRYRFDNPSGSVPCPYNFDAVLSARKRGKPVMICEGATDTLSLYQAGFLACGIVGTQGFKPEWVKHFDDLEVFLATDPDEPGQEAARKIAGIFVSQGRRSPKVIHLPQGQDVTDFFTGNISKNPVNG